jgi:hypothetical protein
MSLVGSCSDVVICLIEYLHHYSDFGGADGGGPIRIRTDDALKSIPIWESHLELQSRAKTSLLNISLIYAYNWRHDHPEGSRTLAVVDSSLDSPCSKRWGGDVPVDMLVRRVGKFHTLIGEAVYSTMLHLGTMAAKNRRF